MRQENGMPKLPKPINHLTHQETTMNTATTSSLNPRIVALSLFVALASTSSLVCSAADGDVLQTMVKYNDLNVSTSQGAGSLYTRIRGAAEQVCRPFNRDDLASKTLFHKCLNHAIADAVSKVGQPALFAVYSAKTGTSKPIVLASSQTR
jgi:UrcA family protein